MNNNEILRLLLLGKNMVKVVLLKIKAFHSFPLAMKRHSSYGAYVKQLNNRGELKWKFGND